MQRDTASTCLSTLALEEEPMEALLAHSITYRFAVGRAPGAGCSSCSPYETSAVS
jgi:hypothetical protein